MKLLSIFVSHFLMYALSEDCFWNSNSLYKYFSSKSSYSFVRGDIRDSFVELKGHEPVSVWTIIRHGKRSPGIGFSNGMKEVVALREHVLTSFKKGKGSICAQDVENLRNWQYDTEILEGKHSLTGEGHREMFEIGKRLRQTLSKLLGDLKEGSYIIRPANFEWIEDCAKDFAAGITNQSLFIENPIPEYDIMDPYDTCPRYDRLIRDNFDIYIEMEKYERNPEYIAMQKRVQKRIGIDFELTSENLTSLYDICRYTWREIDNEKSPWCALLTTEDLKILEYQADLRHYHRNGYIRPLNQIFGRVPLSNLYETFAKYVSGDGKTLTAYFSHSTMMDMMYGALGWNKDDKPLMSTYRDPNRKWRSTFMSTFGTNIMAVLYRSLEDKEQFKVILYTNEEPVTSICERGVCSWQQFEHIFKPFLNTSLDFCYT